MHRRLLVRVPDVSGDEPVWAAACLPAPGIQEGPTVGDGVWIALESFTPTPAKLRDLRLARGLDPAKPFTEKKEATVLAAGQKKIAVHGPFPELEEELLAPHRGFWKPAPKT